MKASGIRLTKLTLTGAGVPDAEISFTAGLNVISGPSDTGKTFIAQCIDFMLGASERPKEIPEAAAYDLVLLSLHAPGDETEFVLQRSVRGGDIRLFAHGTEQRVLGARHHAEDDDTISHFLLELSGLVGRRVRVNAKGVTRTLSFRDLAKLILVREEVVIKEASPIFSGQLIFRTAEMSVFRLLLSGVDDSSVIAKDDPKMATVRQKGMSDVLDLLTERTREQIKELNLGFDKGALQEQLTRIEMSFDHASTQLAVEREAVAALEEQRRTAWRHLRQAESRMEVLLELNRRFGLLKDQYSSDLRRLDAISEAGWRLGQITEERCPICGARAEHHDREHQRQQPTLDNVAHSCRAESQKIRILLADLESTLKENSKEMEHYATEVGDRRAAVEAAATEIRNRLEPRVEVIVQDLRESQKQRDKYLRGIELCDRVEELEKMRERTVKPSVAKAVEGQSTTVGADEVEQFSQVVEALLRAWRFPNLGRVTFSEEHQDIVISGRQRRSHGKGVRAITHAAFSLSLLRYCLDRSMPHPGLVLIDSPLVVYREPDSDEHNFSPAVKDAFYRSLASDFGDAQIIILENDGPPRDVEDNAGAIRFTGTSTGRSGFIPRTG